MILEAALLAVGCTLFVNMGLSDAIQETLGFHSRILSCPKCCSFWVVLVFLIVKRAPFYEVVSASFLLSYLALWLDLGLSVLNRKYNELYEQILSASDAGDPEPAKKRKRSKARKANSGSAEMRKN